jgi:putative flavoprotein involved in K+ transport
MIATHRQPDMTGKRPMPIETTETLIIGAGQAGLAMSGHLSRLGRPHLLLERHRIAERWRSERWDSLVANGPAWHDRFPDLLFDGIDPDDFATKDQIVAYFETYAARIAAPLRTGVPVERLIQTDDGFLATTPSGDIKARNVVVATGAFQRPVIPTVVPSETGLTQIHSNHYRNPGDLPPGGVLVVGAGSSGAQIAEELARAGRRVWLSVGPHDRPPRRYRGKDFVWWLGALGKWSAKARTPGTEHVTISVSGAYGGHTMDFRRLAAQGVTLLGRAGAFADGTLHFASDLAENIARGDANYLGVLDEADAYAAQQGLDLPTEPEARELAPMPADALHPILRLNLASAGIGTIVWATGYRSDFDWIDIDIFDDHGTPRHRDGVSIAPGLYFLGLPWLTCRASSFIWGVWRDAEAHASHIAGRMAP